MYIIYELYIDRLVNIVFSYYINENMRWFGVVHNSNPVPKVATDAHMTDPKVIQAVQYRIIYT